MQGRRVEDPDVAREFAELFAGRGVGSDHDLDVQPVERPDDGWGGIAVDDLSWESRTFDRFSIWGHHQPEASKQLPPALITRVQQA
ncbi:hypothetical protein OG819_02445 [Streptomyces sp. NBC_01549]|uniref:hypothetical protein n=1 Tax=Streptomyces sp. NBC_01549 TaxID=2975874 RepID=UPI0022555F7E|nr:hypothetical protein [Streptomyces sp. NBC_01549]MCX4588639.1 hypothetical protein [Streptomyces sp. NBC_01549]